jgi:hypothetical protein
MSTHQDQGFPDNQITGFVNIVHVIPISTTSKITVSQSIDFFNVKKEEKNSPNSIRENKFIKGDVLNKSKI